jgi:hypothetical protein
VADLLPPPLVHGVGRPLPDLQVVFPLPEFGRQIAVFLGRCRSAFGDAAVVIGGAVLADVLEAGAVNAVIVGGQFGEKGEDVALPIHAEDDDGGFHWRCLSIGRHQPLLFGDDEAVFLEAVNQVVGHAMIDHDRARHLLPVLEGNRAVAARFPCFGRHGGEGDHGAVVGNPKIGFLFGARGIEYHVVSPFDG